MKSQQRAIIFVTVIGLIVPWERNADAFTIRLPPSDLYDPYVKYREEDKGFEGVSYLIEPVSIERGGTAELLALLDDFSRQRGGIWEFERAQEDLQGSFELRHYYACGTQTECGKEIDKPATEGVGAYMELNYYPVLGADPIPDPTNITRNIQWIQRVKSNHFIDPDDPDNPDDHGRIEDVLDINVGQSTPYYTGIAGNGLSLIPPIPYRYFIDRSYRIDSENNHTWNAFLYLAEETTVIGSGKRTVKIYNGIKWGWRNETRSIPEPPPTCDSSGGGGSGGGSGGGGCSESNWAGTNNRELPLFQEDEFDSDDFYIVQQEALELNSFNSNKIDRVETSVATASEPIPQSIPEPGSVAGILTIGLLGIGGQLRKRK